MPIGTDILVEKQQTRAEAKVRELQAYIKGLKGENLEVEEEN